MIAMALYTSLFCGEPGDLSECSEIFGWTYKLGWAAMVVSFIGAIISTIVCAVSKPE